MSVNPNRKELKNQYKMQQKQVFEASLPMPKETFYELFDYLNDQLEINGCDFELTLTKRFLAEAGIEPDGVILWLMQNGAHCDCEVLYDMEELFE